MDTRLEVQVGCYGGEDRAFLMSSSAEVLVTPASVWLPGSPGPVVFDLISTAHPAIGYLPWLDK